MKELTITKKLKIAIVFIGIVIIFVLFISIRQSQRVKNTAYWVEHTQKVLNHIQKILLSAVDNQTGARGFVITNNDKFLEPLIQSKKEFQIELEYLHELVADNPREKILLDSLRSTIENRILFSDSLVSVRKKFGSQAATRLIEGGKGKEIMYNVRRLCFLMESIENDLLEKRKSLNDASVTQLNLLLFSILGIVFLLSIFIIIRIIAFLNQQKENEEKFRALLDSAPDATVIVDESGIITMINHQTEALFGYTKNEMIGKPVEIMVPIPLRGKHVFNREHFAKAPKVREMGAGIELLAVKKDGTDFPVEISLSPITTKEGMLVSASIRDITKRKEAEEFLVTLSAQINQSNDAIYVMDADYKIKSWNLGAEKLYGYTREEVLGKNSNDILQTAITNDEIDATLKKIVKEDYWSGELIRKTKAGKEVNVRSSSTTLRDNKGSIVGYVAVSLDITLQKKLLDQVNFLAQIVEQSSEAILSRGKDKKIITWNKGAENLFGFTKEEAIGKTIVELGFIKITGEEISEIESEIIRNGFWNSERYFFHKDGTYFFGSVTGNIVQNENGEFKSFCFIFKDISRRKQLEDALKSSNEELEEKVRIRTEEIAKSEKLFRMLFDQAVDGIFLSDANGIYQDVNLAGYTMLGYTHEEIIGMHLSDILDKEDIDRLPPTIQSLEQGDISNAEWRFRRKDGSTFIGEVIGRQLPDGRLQGILRDITERKENEKKLIDSEKRFRTSLDNMLEGVQIIGFDWRYIYVNDAMARHGKYLKEELIGHTVMEKYPGIEQAEIFKTYQKCFTERVSIHLENEFLFPDKSKGWFELSFLPVPEGIFILSVDITDRKEAENKLHQLNTELEQRVLARTEELKKANNELDAFTFSVSHDLRAPLRGIIGFSSILEEEYANKMDDEAKRITNVIKKNAQQMGRLIDDLLTFSRLGKKDISKAPINTQSLVEDVINDMQLQNQSNERIKWNIHPLPPVNADISTISQVWINLISNAIKYSGKNPRPNIEIGSYVNDASIVFYVKDNGVGFDVAYKHKLFKVFQRLHSNDEFEGTGVGLALVEKIISRHGGKVWAEGHLNEGACFSFSLPIEKEGIVQ